MCLWDLHFGDVLCADFVGQDVASDRVRNGHGDASLVAGPPVVSTADFLLGFLSSTVLELADGLAECRALLIAGGFLQRLFQGSLVHSFVLIHLGKRLFTLSAQ